MTGVSVNVTNGYQKALSCDGVFFDKSRACDYRLTTVSLELVR